MAGARTEEEKGESRREKNRLENESRGKSEGRNSQTRRREESNRSGTKKKKRGGRFRTKNNTPLPTCRPFESAASYRYHSTAQIKRGEEETHNTIRSNIQTKDLPNFVSLRRSSPNKIRMNHRTVCSHPEELLRPAFASRAGVLNRCWVRSRWECSGWMCETGKN